MLSKEKDLEVAVFECTRMLPIYKHILILFERIWRRMLQKLK